MPNLDVLDLSSAILDKYDIEKNDLVEILNKASDDYIYFSHNDKFGNYNENTYYTSIRF